MPTLGTKREGEMSTDQRRFEVFVSSTYDDLREARQRVTMALLECDAFPTGMEIFPATDDDAWTLIRRIIDDCDYYLLVIAGKYGSIDPTSGLSYTEMEYDYAVSVGKPVMAFLHGSPGKLTADLCESTDERRTKLDNFREKVRKAKHVKLWQSIDELPGHVSLTYTKFVNYYPATGWIRADQASSTESLKELLDAKSRIEQLEAVLEKTKTSAPDGAEDLAQGSDEFHIDYRVSAKFRDSLANVLSESTWVTNETNWDALFAAVAPKLLQEAEERELRKGVERYLLLEFFDDNIQALREEIESTKLGIEGSFFEWEILISNETFGTILVQLTALGLIRKSDRKRSVSNTGTYWALTPYGEGRTVQLRAIKKGQVKVTFLSDDDQDET
jgi:hypothetical protein